MTGREQTREEEVVEALQFVVARVRTSAAAPDHQREKEKQILRQANAELQRLTVREDAHPL